MPEPAGPLFSRRSALAAFAGLLAAACSNGTRPIVDPGTTSGATATGPSGTTSSPPSTAAGPPTSVVRGSNAELTHDVLASDAKSYNGTWSGTWTEADGPVGTVTVAAALDPDARTLTLDISVDQSILDGDPFPTAHLTGSVDSFTYTQDGAFTIRQDTPLGKAVMTSDKGIGSGTFKLHIAAIPGHSDVASIDMTGVANRPDSIPVHIVVTANDGTTSSADIAFTKSS